MTRIEVIQFYSGLRIGNQTIRPGIYAEDDAALFGATDFLLERGIARRIVVTVAIPNDVPNSTMTEDALDIANDQHTPVSRKRRAVG